MNKLIVGSIVVAAVVIGVWAFTKKTDDAGETATTTPEVATTTQQTPVFEDGAGGPPAERGAYADGSYALDTEESSIAWTGSKTLILNYEDNGTLAFSSGSVVVSNGHITSGDFTIDMTSFSVSSTGRGSGNDTLENHLKSDDFFAVETYPTATVALRGVVNGVATADVTIKGITKTISFPATITQEGNDLSGSATLTLDRTLWDVRYGSDTFFDNLGDNVIDDKVKVVLSLRAALTQ